MPCDAASSWPGTPTGSASTGTGWAEHHGSPALACRAPEVLIGPLAAATSRIRLGSGGIMLPHYSPAKVAETFGMLAAMYPGRVDLGIGRAAGTDARTTFALQRDRREASPDDFSDQLDELLAYLNGTMPAQHPFARVAETLPVPPGSIPAYLLGVQPAERDLGRRAVACRTCSPTSSTPAGRPSPPTTGRRSSRATTTRPRTRSSPPASFAARRTTRLSTWPGRTACSSTT